MAGTWFSPSVCGILNAPGNADRPNWVAPIKYLGQTGPGEQFFDPSAFSLPAQNTFGNAGRNIIQGPGFGNFDAALHRNFRIRERWNATLRMESFNFTNTAHYSNLNSSAQSPQFGQINSAEQDQRQFQIGLTVRFQRKAGPRITRMPGPLQWPGVRPVPSTFFIVSPRPYTFGKRRC